MRSLLHDSERTLVERVTPADGPAVVRKTPRGPRAAERVRGEREVLARLAGIRGIPRLTVESDEETLCFLDDRGRPLSETPGPWETGPLVELARSLAAVLAAIHRHGVVHRDVSPGNILIPGPVLIDFELAAATDLEDSGLAGSLPYLAPEQTGRTGRPVDHRADLYALGAVLYELITGEPPFGRDGDPLRLVHDHLARVPEPPGSGPLAAIVMRLLAKEPELRYQSAEGLAYDLSLVGDGEPAVLGERDFPMRLAPPDRLVGRDGALATLRGLFTGAVTGNRSVVLVTGPPGVGKTSLVDRLRPTVAAAGGYFLTGRSDPYRRDMGANAVGQAFGALGAQLLAESDQEMALLRVRLTEELGPDAGLAAAVIPPFATLLGVAPEPGEGDPTAGIRIRRVGMAVLRSVASGARPVVFFLDDLQWAGPVVFGFLDAVLDESDLPGVLVLGAYRERDVDAAHPLTGLLHRLGGSGVVQLENLPQEDVGTLLGEMLRLPAAEAAPLAEVLTARTAGNPFDTVELVNALRREGALVPEGAGWRWDATELRRFVGRGDVVDLLGARVAALPPETRSALEVMACLGGDASLPLLQIAAPGLSLQPAVEDGLVVVEADVARFRHDRVRQAVHQSIDLFPHLELARRLAGHPEHAAIAAEQYLPVAGRITEEGERRTVLRLLRSAAAGARLVANHAAAETFLAAAVRLDASDDPELRTEWHRALCDLARFDEADAVFAALTEVSGAAVCQQLVGLTSRARLAEALELGLGMLGRLGVGVPDRAEMTASVIAGLAELRSWPERPDWPELRDPALIAAAQVINRLMPSAFFADRDVLGWLTVTACRMWAGQGTAAPLVAPISHLSFVAVATEGDYRLGYDVLRRVLTVADDRGYEPAASHAKLQLAVAGQIWFEPIESGLILARRARDGLLRGGELQMAAASYLLSVPLRLECLGVDACAIEAEAGMALAARTGFARTASGLMIYRQYVRAMRGETDGPGSFGDADFDESAFEAELNTRDLGMRANYHAFRALAAALFGAYADLERHVRLLEPVAYRLAGTNGETLIHLVRLLDAVHPGARPENAQPEIDRCWAFFVARAADRPAGYRHLVLLAAAESARINGDFPAAALAFDEAARCAAGAGRPWQAALIAERTGWFLMASGMEHAARHALAEAVRGYAAWGATAKARWLDLHAGTAPAAPATTTTHSLNLSTESIDLLAVLAAARALSADTDLERLRARVEEVLSAMTGATSVRLVLADDTGGWLLPADLAVGRPPLTLAEAAGQGLLPLTALRYAERTREPMLIDDAARDDRVARDAYFAGLDHCSLLVVPVLSQGAPRAMLVLENRLARRAFSATRLDAVQLIAGQLTVSLDNALLYASLERKVAERTEELAAANRQLELLTLTDPLTGLANRRRLTGVLEAEWLRGLRSGEPIGLAMIDVDHFKRYNDHYGHQAGDRCLALVASALRDSVRVTDVVARYGGEEFCVIMPDTTAAGARVVAERACRAVSRLREPHEFADSGVVTVSVGVAATAPEPDATPGDLIRIADDALYHAKRDGRNQVATGGWPPAPTD
ncbi:diguanylate cyclase [Actinoplanes sp. NPDC051851]|uniref:diguanylate cyclase domain-containing protein n=1 Tax=Actinoplanes sp. NPDC051851 TaxID=3154753 RepID=UPI00343AE8C0